MAATVGVLFLSIPRVLLGFFGVQDPVVTQIAVRLLMFLSVSGLFITVALAYTGGLQGTGDTRSPFYISLVSQLIIPIGIVRRPSGDDGTRVDGHMACHPHRAHDPMCAQRHPFPAGQVARHQSEHRAGKVVTQDSPRKTALLRRWS